MFKVLEKGIKKAFSRHLLVTNVTLSLSLSGTGDVLQQHYQITKKKQITWDAMRTKNMMFTGATIGALCHYWYEFLDKKLPGRTLKTVGKKLLLDQILFSPMCVGVFLISLYIIKHTDHMIVNSHEYFKAYESKSNAFVAKDFLDKGWRLYIADILVWPPAQLINFYYLPTKYRVLFDNLVSLVFDIYTSHVCYNNKEIVESHDKVTSIEIHSSDSSFVSS